ncbi:uncharacterized protein LOC135935945 [Cloeon dipterum]|uniref:uncharacterized protein LOC135935945 n=1 Tax=Cloeon dipterum TaxID=197152 RepID=UPI00322027CA
MPDEPSLGYFVLNDQTKQNADNVCVLVAHYNFENTKNEAWIRGGDAQDVENLEKTFKVNRNCKFSSILSPGKGELLQLLSNQEKLLRLFGTSEDVPSVFVLYILSHGHRDGIIFTDYFKDDAPASAEERARSTDPIELFVSFTTTEIFESLKKLTNFEECLKFINFGPCRGELIDAVHNRNQKNTTYENENSCRITYSPLMRNTVVFFSTVETTMANRDQTGTTFARHTCTVLDSLEKDESFINVLTAIQYESQKNYTEQTPEVKMFTQSRSFVFSKSPSASSMSDAHENEKRGDYYCWEKLRRRLAFLFSAEPIDKSEEIKSALSQNLYFETSELKLIENLRESINKVSGNDSDFGCIFLFMFGRLSENQDMEVCVQMNNKKTAVSEVLRELIGPKNYQWIGKPKILFLVNQESGSFDAKGTNHEMEISATNHSGWLVHVLHNKDELQKLIDIFKGQELKKEKTLQELLASLLISGSKENRDLLNSTLQYLLKFPDPFVKPSFSVTKSNEYRQERVSFDSLVKESAGKIQVWLLSSFAGTGKTTILREIAFQLGILSPEFKILRFSLPKVQFRGQKKKNVVDEIEFLTEATENSREEIIKSLENKQCVVLLDGFDEIPPESQETTLKVIKALEEKLLSVWIGTRPHAAEAVLKCSSSAVLVQIEPLDKEQQIELIQLKTGKRRDVCEGFIKDFPAEDILENPLDLSFVAQSNVEGNLYQIYEKVVEHKLELSLLRNGYDKNNKKTFQEELDTALERLQEIASCHIKGEEIDGELRERLEEMNCHGFATFENNEVLFIRQNFAEFLAAQYFLQEIKDSGECIEEAANAFFGQSFPRCKRFLLHKLE